jgi:hypothetical protein
MIFGLCANAMSDGGCLLPRRGKAAAGEHRQATPKTRSPHILLSDAIAELVGFSYHSGSSELLRTHPSPCRLRPKPPMVVIPLSEVACWQYLITQRLRLDCL